MKRKDLSNITADFKALGKDQTFKDQETYETSEGISIKKEYKILPFLKIEPRKTLVTPIVVKRLAEDLEKSQMPK